jgi:hypothetical protein
VKLVEHHRRDAFDAERASDRAGTEPFAEARQQVERLRADFADQPRSRQCSWATRPM